MGHIVKVTDHIYWVGANDYRVDRFENLFPLKHGVAYNSYLICDEKTCLMDTVDQAVTDQYLDNIKTALQERDLDYLVINHMEPDHCGNIETICRLYPNCQLVGNSKTFQFLEQFYGTDYQSRYYVVKEKETLSLGQHTLQFLMAPMAHWPEVMVVYEQSHKML